MTDNFDSAKALAVTQDLLSRFPKGQLDAIIMQGPDASAAVDFAVRSGRDEIKFIVGDYDENMRQLIYEGKIFGTVDQDPYPQAYNAMRMAWLHFNGKDAEIPRARLPAAATGDQGERREEPRGVGLLSGGAIGAVSRATTSSLQKPQAKRSTDGA